MNREKTVDKIKKLFKLAKGNTTEAESQQAILMARKLMVKHNIDSSEVEDREDEIVSVIIDEYVRTIHLNLACIICDSFGIKSTTGLKARHNRIISFVGFQEDINIAFEVYKFAKESMEYHADQFVKRFGKGKIDFKKGYVIGLQSALVEQTEEMQEEGLIIVVNPKIEDKINDLTKGKSHKAQKSKPITNKRAYFTGMELGEDFDMKRKQLSE